MYNTSKGNYSVKLNKVIEKFNLKNLTPEVDTKKIVIRQTDVNRPALQFAGYFEYFDYSRIQLIGKVEYSYLKMHDDDYIREMTEKIFKAGIPCMIFCRGLEPRPLFMELGNKYGVPVLATDDGTSSFFSELNRFLKIELAPRISIHGVLVDVFGEGVLITGESGIGKSEAALELVKRGHRLVSDDVVEIKKTNNDELIGTAPDINNNGSVLEALAGDGAVCGSSANGASLAVYPKDAPIDSRVKVGPGIAAFTKKGDDDLKRYPRRGR